MLLLRCLPTYCTHTKSLLLRGFFCSAKSADRVVLCMYFYSGGRTKLNPGGGVISVTYYHPRPRQTTITFTAVSKIRCRIPPEVGINHCPCLSSCFSSSDLGKLPVHAARRNAAATVTVAAAKADGGGGAPAAQEGGAGAGAPARVPRSLDRSAPPSFIANVNLDGDFVVSREGEPTAAELANENLIKIVAEKSTDEELNWLLWKCLGEGRFLGAVG